MSVPTKFVSYTPGPPDNLFIDQRELKVLKQLFSLKKANFWSKLWLLELIELSVYIGLENIKSESPIKPLLGLKLLEKFMTQ